MTVLLGTLVVVGRILLILVLVVLAVAAVFLLAPVGLTLRWTPAAGFRVGAYAGPLHRILFPWQHRKKKKEKKPPKAAASPAPSGPDSRAAAPEASTDGKQTVRPTPDRLSAAPSAEQEASLPEPETEPPLPPVGPQPEELTPGEEDALLGAARIFFGALVPYRARLLRGVQVKELEIFWSVTGEDAADTAVAYGRWIALSNNLLTLARQYLTIRAKSLRLEPDFTGTLAEKRIFSCQIRTRPYIILLILFYLMRRDGQGHTPLQEIMDKLGTLS